MATLMFATVLTIAATAAPTPTPTVSCAMEFDGNKFLAAAEVRALKPEEIQECSTVEVGKNKFYARADHECKLLFRNERWLKKGTFQAINGRGKSTTIRNDEGVLVTIAPQEGFYAVLFKITVERQSCENLTVNDALQ